MSLPENTDVFYLRRKKLPYRTFKLWSEAPGSDNTKLFKQANLWATQARNTDLLSCMETQTVLVASHATLAKGHNST